jgi:hypothetical protein
VNRHVHIDLVQSSLISHGARHLIQAPLLSKEMSSLTIPCVVYIPIMLYISLPKSYTRIYPPAQLKMNLS